MGEFSERVYEVVRRIPRGTVATYGQIARLIGAPRSARFIGYALRANPAPGEDADSVPCHRVVFKDGALCSGYVFGGPEMQRQMLVDEGIVFDADGHVDMERCQWDGRNALGEDSALPTAPPPGFDWKRELAEDGD